MDTHPSLRVGDRGLAVKALQRALRMLGYEMDINGRYDAGLALCVQSFQDTHGLPGHGRTDDDTWQALLTATETIAVQPIL